jgi:hypothetical protein
VPVYDPQFSESEASLFFVLTGQRPPLASRAEMLAAADVLSSAAGRVEGELIPQLSGLVNRVLSGMDTAVSVEFAKSMEAYVSKPPFYLPSVADQYRQLALYTQSSADEFLMMKVQSIVILASFLVAIAIDLLLTFYGGEEAAFELLAAEATIVRLILSTLIGRLLTHLVATMVMSIAIQEALDAIAQLAVSMELHQSWNWEETLEMLEVGALGGAMGLVLMPAGHVLEGWLGHVMLTGVDKALGKGFDLALGDAGKNLVKGASDFAVGGVVGGFHNWAHAEAFSAFTHTPDDNAAGAFVGGFWMGGAKGLVEMAKTVKVPGTLTVTIPVEDLLTRGLGGVNPDILNDIARGGPRGDGGDGPGGDKFQEPGGTGGDKFPEPGGGDPDLVEAVPPAVALLHAAGIDAGIDTAYRVALRTGFVPTIGEAAEHSLFRESVTADIPMTGHMVPRDDQPQLPDPSVLTSGHGPGDAREPVTTRVADPAPQPAAPLSRTPSEPAEERTAQPTADVPGRISEPAADVPGRSAQPTADAPGRAPEPVSSVPDERPLTREPATTRLTDPAPPPAPLPTRTSAEPNAVPGRTAEPPAGVPGRTAEPVGSVPGEHPLTQEPGRAGPREPNPAQPVQQQPSQPVSRTAGGPLPERATDGPGRPGEEPASATGLRAQPAGRAASEDTGLPGRSSDLPARGTDLPARASDLPAGEATGPVRDASDGGALAEEPRADGGRPVPAPADPARAEPGPAERGPAEQGPVTDTGKTGTPEPVRVQEGSGGAGAGRDHPGAGSPDVTRPGQPHRVPGAEPDADSVLPGGLRDGGQPHVVTAAGTQWARDDGGWHVAGRDGALDRGLGADEGARFEVPAGSRAVLDAAGGLAHVVLPDGVSFERGLDGAWSAPRERSGEVVAVKLAAPEELRLGDGRTVELPAGSEQVNDNGVPVAYRQLKEAGPGGARLVVPRLFTRDGDGGWAERPPVDAASYEGWLAAANQRHEAARTLFDIAARSGPEVPADRRLDELSAGELKELLLHGGKEGDAFAALYEHIRSKEGIALRYTQVAAVHELAGGSIVNMAAGEGKSWVFLADAALRALRPDVDAVHLVTTRGNLADREFEEYSKLLGPLGYDIHRINSDRPAPAVAEGTPTIYIGTSEDIAFTFLKTEQLPGGPDRRLHVSIDEIDEAQKYSDGSYYLSNGTAEAAPEATAAAVRGTWADLAGHLDRGELDEADFGRVPGQRGGPARLTGEGLARLEALRGQPLDDTEVHNLNLAASARWEYVYKDHYEVHEGKVYIIDQTSDEVMYNPETAGESRWNGDGVPGHHSLAQLVEAKHEAEHGTVIRADSDGSSHITARELYEKPQYKSVTGASGTAEGHFDNVASIDRYYDHQLEHAPDYLAEDHTAKVDAIIAHVTAVHQAGAGRPQLVIAHRNGMVSEISERLDQAGIPHATIDAKWFLEQGTNREAAFNAAVRDAGLQGKVLVINRQGGRGVDFGTNVAGGIHVVITARSHISAAIDQQAENRTARSGAAGSVAYFTARDDLVFANSANPAVHVAVTRHALAVREDEALATPDTHAELTHAEAHLRDLLPAAQAEAAARLGIDTPGLQAHPPPEGSAVGLQPGARPGELPSGTRLTIDRALGTPAGTLHGPDGSVLYAGPVKSFADGTSWIATSSGAYGFGASGLLVHDIQAVTPSPGPVTGQPAATEAATRDSRHDSGTNDDAQQPHAGASRTLGTPQPGPRAINWSQSLPTPPPTPPPGQPDVTETSLPDVRQDTSPDDHAQPEPGPDHVLPPTPPPAATTHDFPNDSDPSNDTQQAAASRPEEGSAASGGVRSRIQANDHLRRTVNLLLGEWRDEGKTDLASVGIADIQRALGEIPAGGPTDHRGLANDIAEHLAWGAVTRIRGGAFGRELETEFSITGLPKDIVKHVLVSLPELSLVTDLDESGTIIEIVENPVNGLAGETRRLPPEQVSQATAAVMKLLNSHIGRGKTIYDIFKNVPGATLTEHARLAVLGSQRNVSMYVQHTVGVSASVMYDFIEAMADKSPVATAVHHASSALQFGDEVSTKFAETGATGRPAPEDPDTAVVRGFMALAYTQVAALLEGILATEKELPRNHAVVVSRVPLANIRKRLPGPVGDFLVSNADWIGGVFYERYAADNLLQMQAAEIATESKLLAQGLAEDGRNLTIGSYLDNALVPVVNRDDLISQEFALEVSTELPEVDDESGGRRDDPLVPLEVRYYGGLYESLQEADDLYDKLKATVRELDKNAQLLRKLRSDTVTISVGGAHTRPPDVQREELRPFARYVADMVAQGESQDGTGGGPEFIIHVEGDRDGVGRGGDAGVDGAGAAFAVRDAVQRVIEEELSALGLVGAVSYLVTPHSRGNSSEPPAAGQPSSQVTVRVTQVPGDLSAKVARLRVIGFREGSAQIDADERAALSELTGNLATAIGSLGAAGIKAVTITGFGNGTRDYDTTAGKAIAARRARQAGLRRAKAVAAEIRAQLEARGVATDGVQFDVQSGGRGLASMRSDRRRAEVEVVLGYSPAQPAAPLPAPAERVRAMEVGRFDIVRGKLRADQLDAAGARAWELVGRYRQLSLAEGPLADKPTVELSPLEQVIRRVAYYLHTQPSDQRGAEDLARKLLQDTPPQARPVAQVPPGPAVGTPGEAPLGAKETRSGFYIPASPSEATDLQGDELTAAQFFPEVDGATVLHVHFTDGGFLAGGSTLIPEQFKEQVLDHLRLEPGQPLILVACQTAGLPGGTRARHAASALASLTGRPVIAATGDTYTTPGDANTPPDGSSATPEARVVTIRSGFDANGYPIIDGGLAADWVIAWPDGTQSLGFGADLLPVLGSTRLADYLPGLVVRASGPAEPPSAVKWARGAQADPLQTGHARDLPRIPQGAAPAPGRVRGYLAWPGSLEDFRQQAMDGTLIGRGNTHLWLSAAALTDVPRNTHLIELTIGGGAALRLPGAQDSRLWLPADRLDQATVLAVYRGTGADRERAEAFGVQGRRLSDLAEGRPVISSGIPGGAESVLRVRPAEPQITTSVSLALRSEMIRTVSTLGGASLGTGGPIRWLVKDARGIPRRNAQGETVYRNIGLALVSAAEREEAPWEKVTFSSKYVLKRQKLDNSSTWEARDLPFQVTERTFFVQAHSNPYIMVGEAIEEGPHTRALNLRPGYRAVSGAKLARTVMESEAYQQAVRTYGDSLEVVLFACMAAPHARKFAATLGRPAWTTNGVAIVGPTPLGHRIGLRMREGEFEPGWYLATPSGSILEVTPVPSEGKATRSGFYIPASPAEATDLQADELTAAQFFPEVDGATVLHVHFSSGGFRTGDGTLAPEQFKEQVLDHLSLEPGQPLILVACQTAGLPGGTRARHAAAALASLTGRPVIAATGDTFTTPEGRVITSHSGFDASGLPVVDNGTPAHWVIARPDGTLSPELGTDLLGILDGKALAVLLPGVGIREGGSAEPPRQTVKWAPDAQAGPVSAPGVPEVPAEAVLEPDRARGYLTWPGSLADFRRQIREEGTLIGAGHTHLELSSAEPGTLPYGTHLIELTIGGGVALGLPDVRDSRLWLTEEGLNQATVLGVYRDTWAGRQWADAFGIQGRILGDLVAERPPPGPAIPDDATVLPAEPQIRNDAGLSLLSVSSLASAGLRIMTSLAGAELGPAEAIRWWVKDADGLPETDADGLPLQRAIGLSFHTPEERQETPWGRVIFNGSYALERVAPDGSSTWESRGLPFQVSERTFFVMAHANPYLMVGPAQAGLLPQALSGYQGYRTVSPARLARAVLENDVYQQAVREHGNDLEVVLFACMAIPHAQEFAATLGRPAWSTNGVTIVGPTGLGDRIGLRMQEGDFEPRWYLAQQSGPIRQVTTLPFGGEATRSGFYIPASPAEAASLRADEFIAAQSFPQVAGATVLHVHFANGGFLAGGGTLAPDEFKEQVLDRLGLEPHQPLIVVACQAAAQPASTGTGLAATALATLTDRPVIAATGDAFTTPDAQVVTAHIGFDPSGLPVVDSGRPADWVVARPDGTVSPGLGSNLLEILDGSELATHLPGVAATESGSARPPAQAVKWGQAGSRDHERPPGAGRRATRAEPGQAGTREARSQADLVDLVSLRQELRRLRSVVAGSQPAGEPPPQARERAARIADAQDQLPAVRAEIARLTGREPGETVAAAARDEAAQPERQWQQVLAAARAGFPSGRPAVRPDLSFAEANAEVERYVATAEQEARRAWDRLDPVGAGAYAAYHGDLARSHAWHLILDDLGIDRPEPDAGGPPPAGTGVLGAPERSEVLARLRESENLLAGMLAETQSGSPAWGPHAQREVMSLIAARLRRVEADIDVFEHTLPGELAVLEQERERRDGIPGWPDLPFAGPLPGSVRQVSARAQSKLAEVKATIATLPPGVGPEVGGPPGARTTAAPPRRDLAREEAEAWVREQETAAEARALMSYPGEIGTPAHIAYIILRADQAREDAWTALMPASRRGTGGRRPSAVELVAEMSYLARAAAHDLLAEVPAAVLDDMRADIERLLSRPGTASAPTPGQRQEIEARLDRLERITAVVRPQETRQLAEEYLAAQPAPPEGEEAAAARIQAVVSAAYVRMLADLAPDIRAAWDAPAHPAPPLPGSIREELSAAQQRASDAAAAVAEADKDAAFRESVGASLQGLQDRIVELAGAQLVPDRAIAARKLMADARMHAATQAGASDSEVPASPATTIPAPAGSLPPGVTWLRAPSDASLHTQAAAAAPWVAGWATLVAHTDRGVVVDGDDHLDEEAIAIRLGFRLAEDGINGTPQPLRGGPAGAIIMVSDWDAGAFHRLIGKPVLAPRGQATIVLTTGEVIAGSWGQGARGERVPLESGDWVVWENGEPRSLHTPYLREAARQLGLQLQPPGDQLDRAVGFYSALTEWQTAALNELGYSVASPAPARPASAGGFYESLLAVAAARLEAVLGPAPEPDRVRQRIVDEVERDIRSPRPRYGDLIAGDQAPQQVLADLRDPGRWSRQAAELIPHVAADVFGIDLRVLGLLGQAAAVGAVGGPRADGPDGQPYLLVRMVDGRFVPARRVDGADPPAWPLPATGSGELTAWAMELSPDEQRLVGQDVMSAPLPWDAAEPAAIGRVAEMNYLAEQRALAFSEVEFRIRRILAGHVQVQLGRRPGPEAPGDLDLIEGEDLGVIQDAEEYSRQLGQLINADDFESRTGGLREEYSRAAAQAGLDQRVIPALAGVAAKVRTLAEQLDPGRWGSAPPGQRGTIRAELDRQANRAAREVRADVNARFQELVAQRVLPAQQFDDPAQTRLDQERYNREFGAVIDDLQQQEPDGALYGSLIRVTGRATDVAVGDILRGLRPEIEALTDGMTAYLVGGRSHLLRAAQQRAAAATAAAEAYLRPHWDGARNTAGWQARYRAALEAFHRTAPARELPPGFGAPVLDGNGQLRHDSQGRVIRSYPLGHKGRLWSVNDVPLSDGRGLAALVTEALPQANAGLAGDVRDEIEKFIREQGRHAFTQRLLEGGLEVEVHADVDGRRQRLAVVVGLDLDMDHVHHVAEIDTAPTPVGETEHHAVEADHEVIAGSRRTVEAERNLTGRVDITKAFGSGGLVAATISLTGTSTAAYTSGYDTVSAAKRAPRYEHESAYFDFRGASLRTTVHPELAARPPRTGRLPLSTVRAAFPLEVAPEKDLGDPPGAFRETPRTLPGSKRYGYTPAEVAADTSGRRLDVARRIEPALHHVLSEPEWAGAGLKDLRDQVLGIFRQDGPVDKDVAAAVEFFLSEPSVLRNYADLFGSGTISPMIRDSRGNDIGQLAVTARVRAIQPSWIGDLGIKEESQRFSNVWDTKEQSGSVVLTAGASLGKRGRQANGAPEDLGGGNDFNGGLLVGLSLSASRTLSANTGSGDIRGMVIWGHSVLYLAGVRFTVQVVRPKDTFTSIPRAQGMVQMGLRVPGIQRARFEELLERAGAGPVTTIGLPVDNEPDAAGLDRYPPESMVAGAGIGFSMIVALQGAEAVLPEALSMIRQADGNLPWARDWTPAELIYVQSQLTPRFTREALTAHASVVFQPGGVRAEIFRPARSGWEIITVTVAASHGDEPSALGRVARATLEVMPSAFAGTGGEDTVGSSANLNVSFDATLGLGVHHFPKGLGFLAQGTAARSVTATTSAGATGFSLQAMLYEGPARLFTYNDVQYRIDVSVRHQVNVSVPSLAHWFGHVLADEITSAARKVARALSAADQAPAAARVPAPAALTRTLPGSVQFISHEDLARENPVDPAAVKGNVGRTVVVHRFGSQQDRPAPRAGRTPARRAHSHRVEAARHRGLPRQRRSRGGRRRRPGDGGAHRR